MEINWSLKYEGFLFDLELIGMGGIEWIARLEFGGYSVGDYPKSMMAKFWPAPTGNLFTKVVIFPSTDNSFEEVCTSAISQGLKQPHPEVACLLREILNEGDIRAMGFSEIVVMHNPIKDRYGDHEVLVVDMSRGSRALTARPVRGLELEYYHGVAFEA